MKRTKEKKRKTKMMKKYVTETNLITEVVVSKYDMKKKKKKKKKKMKKMKKMMRKKKRKKVKKK